MTGYPSGEPKLCWIGRTIQKAGCLPKKSTSTPFVYPITLHSVDAGYGYSNDIKYKLGPRFPPPQPDEPQLQMAPYVAPYQYEPPRVPKSPKKTPVAQTVPLSTLPLPVNALPFPTPSATCVTLNADLPPVQRTRHTPHVAPLSIPYTPQQTTVPDSVLHGLGHITPTQYIWNTPHGALTYTPASTSHLLLPNPLADLSPCSPHILDLGDGNDGWLGPGVIPGVLPSDSSDSSSDCSDPNHQFGFTLNRLLASNCLLPGETSIEWNVSDPVDMVRDVQNDAEFVRGACEPATDPPTYTLSVELYFIDQPGARWNWEPITIRKARPIRITDVFHAIHDYFQRQLTHPEWDIIKSHGKRNAKIVADSWRDRADSQPGIEAQLQVRDGGLRRVDCLGSSKIFAGLWVDGSRVKLSLRA